MEGGFSASQKIPSLNLKRSRNSLHYLFVANATSDIRVEESLTWTGDRPAHSPPCLFCLPNVDWVSARQRDESLPIGSRSWDPAS